MPTNESAILIVDDEPQCLNALKILLQLEGFANITECNDSRKAADLVDRNEYSAALIDLSMPHLSGYDLLEHFRKSCPGLPAIVVTAADEATSAVACLKSGAFDYVVKPIDKGKLVPSVHRAVEFTHLRRENKLLKDFLLADDIEANELAAGPRGRGDNGNLLLETRKEYRSLVHRMPIPVFVTVIETCDTAYCNNAFARFFGFADSRETIDADIRLIDYLIGENAEVVLTEMSVNRRVENREVSGVTPAGKEFTIILSCEEFPEEGIVSGSFIDISERKALEGQLLHAQKMEAVGRLAGGIAHDFNSVLASISGYADVVLLDSSSSESVEKYVSEIKQVTRSASSLTGQLLTFSRKEPLDPEPVGIHGIIEATRNMLARLLDSQITLEIDLKAGRDVVEMGTGQFEQILMNLVINARDAIEDKGAIIITTRNSGAADPICHSMSAGGADNRLVICVTDTGCGIPDGARSRLFEPFFTTKESGTGLGLSTVFGIVEQNGGCIHVDTALKSGTTFAIYLPLSE